MQRLIYNNRKERKDFNNKRIADANDENEIWKITKEISNPRNETSWKLKTDNGTTDDHQKIADEFNKFFVDKIVNLKANIDKDYVEDPLSKLM